MFHFWVHLQIPQENATLKCAGQQTIAVMKANGIHRSHLWAAQCKNWIRRQNGHGVTNNLPLNEYGNKLNYALLQLTHLAIIFVLSQLC